MENFFCRCVTANYFADNENQPLGAILELNVGNPQSDVGNPQGDFRACSKTAVFDISEHPENAHIFASPRFYAPRQKADFRN